MIQAVHRLCGGDISNGIRGTMAGGAPPDQDVIQYITIATTGNAIDFGDLTLPRYGLGGCAGT